MNILFSIAAVVGIAWPAVFFYGIYLVSKKCTTYECTDITKLTYIVVKEDIRYCVDKQGSMIPANITYHEHDCQLREDGKIMAIATLPVSMIIILVLVFHTGCIYEQFIKNQHKYEKRTVNQAQTQTQIQTQTQTQTKPIEKIPCAIEVDIIEAQMCANV